MSNSWIVIFSLITAKLVILKERIYLGNKNYVSEEFKRLFGKKSAIITVIIALLVPLVYAMIVLSPKWGPYDNLDNLPVAVVNNDEGAISDGERVNIGDKLIDSLQENRALGWDFITSEEAQKGMDNLKYYMTIEVPEDFSKKALTVMDDNPERPELEFTQNEGLHFMAAQVTKNAIELVKNQLATQITETYVDNVFSQLGEVGDGFQEAADGAEQINDGAGQLKDGSDQILTALTDKSSDIGRLADGAKQLEDGTKTMKDSLVSKQGDISKLADGAQQLNDGTGELLSNLRGKSGDIGKLAAGAQQVNDGTGQLLTALNDKAPDIKRLSAGANELSKGASDLHDGASQLLAGAKKAKSGSTQLKAGLDEQIVPGLNELAGGVEEAQKGVNETIDSMRNLQESLSFLSTLPKDHPFYDGILTEVLAKLEESLQEAPTKQERFQMLVDGANKLKTALSAGSLFNDGLTALDSGLGELVTGQEQLLAGTVKLEDGAKQVAEGNKTVTNGWTELQTNVGKLHAGTSQVAAGNQTVKSGWDQLTDGANQLHAGSSQIAVGNATVESGWRELSAGASQLHDGSSQVADGNKSVKEGWNQLTDGVTQVDDGLEQLVDGSDELKTGLQGGAERTSEIDPTEENIEMFAEPVVLSGEVINSFPFYRDSNAPYILTLALYVGILIMSFVVQYEKPAILPPSAITWFGGKVAKLSLLAIAQALIISLYSLIVLKIEVTSSIAFILYSIWVSLTFLMIVMFLVVLAGNIGRFIALAFVVLQLSTTGSALPVHMLPEGLRNLSVFLPFTYSINGYRNIITLGNTSSMWASISVLFIYFALFAILALVVFFVKYRSLRVENPEVSETAI